MGQNESACAWDLEKSCEMFTWLAILCCPLVCGGGESKSPYKSYAGKKRPKKGLGHQMMHGEVIWKPGIDEIAKGKFTAPHMNPQLQRPACWSTLGYGLWQ